MSIRRQGWIRLIGINVLQDQTFLRHWPEVCSRGSVRGPARIVPAPLAWSLAAALHTRRSRLAADGR